MMRSRDYALRPRFSPGLTGLLVALLAAAPAGAQPYLDVVISELMYHPTTSSVPAGGGESVEDEYLELTNRGAETAYLDGWRLGDGVRYTFPAGTTLLPGDRLVVAKDPVTAEARYGITGTYGPFDGRLANGGERIELRNADDGLVCEVDYDDESPWPTGGYGDGRSIELTDLTKNHNVGRFAPIPLNPPRIVASLPDAAQFHAGVRYEGHPTVQTSHGLSRGRRRKRQ